MTANELPVLPKVAFAFDTLAVGASQEVVIADRVPLWNWREVTLIVRVHSHTLAGTGNQITVRVYPQSWTPEDPGLTFLNVFLFNVSIGSATGNPGMLTASVPMLGNGAVADRVRITAIGSRVQAGSMDAAISLELSTKDV
jgi:hypothetical protein